MTMMWIVTYVVGSLSAASAWCAARLSHGDSDE